MLSTIGLEFSEGNCIYCHTTIELTSTKCEEGRMPRWSEIYLYQHKCVSLRRNSKIQPPWLPWENAQGEKHQLARMIAYIPTQDHRVENKKGGGGLVADLHPMNFGASLEDGKAVTCFLPPPPPQTPYSLSKTPNANTITCVPNPPSHPSPQIYQEFRKFPFSARFK